MRIASVDDMLAGIFHVVGVDAHGCVAHDGLGACCGHHSIVALVIAGAGAGKTTTVAAKVKYLVEKKDIDPSQILVVSFTNKAVQELRDKLNKDLKIDCPIATFHSTGNAILRKQSDEKLNIVDSSKLYFVIQDYFKNSILKNESLVNNLIMFFASYIEAAD